MFRVTRATQLYAFFIHETKLVHLCVVELEVSPTAVPHLRHVVASLNSSIVETVAELRVCEVVFTVTVVTLALDGAELAWEQVGSWSWRRRY